MNDDAVTRDDSVVTSEGRSVVIVSGTRADYGIYLPVAQCLQAAGWRVSFLLTGMHLLEKYGDTAKLIAQDGFDIFAKVSSIAGADTPANMGRATASELTGFLDALEAHPNPSPDWVLLLGDRGEMLAGALAALYLGISTAHLHGGEISGTIDEPIRHAISKLASLHFTATQVARQRLLAMGEEERRVFAVGAPRLDTIKSTKLPTWDEIAKRYALPVKPGEYLLLVFHPDVNTFSQTAAQTQQVLEGCHRAGLPVVAIAPNADAGSEQIRDSYADCGADFTLVPNFAPLDYLRVLADARVLVGNSSSGIIEAASYGIPVVNVGERQSGRERSNNVIDVPTEAAAIAQGCLRAMSADFRQQIGANIYGDGQAAERICQVLSQIQDPKAWFVKRLAY